ncbi:MAG: response regulator transcription factor [Gemmatimonadetes bacterium]|nr:response regulator transcription factor [Gemmatimonadota bacterium]
MTQRDADSPIVWVVDDDEAVRGALELLFESVSMPVASFASAQEFLERYDVKRPGCLVLDLRMPGMSGLELQEELNRRGSDLGIVFVTGHGDVPVAVSAMRAGAVDFLQKPFRDEDLLSRVRRAMERGVTAHDEHAQRDQVRERLARLTPREREVMRHVISGKPNKAVAMDLGVSERTVEIHRARVMQKMKAGSLAELVRLALAAGETKIVD